MGELASDVIGEDDAATTLRLKRLSALQQLEQPLLLLVGGATGTGKSTIATEAAHRLGITRVTSTDFIRQTMRAFSEEFMPSVHYSSFEARLALTRAEEEESGDAAILGFLDQTRNVAVGVQAALERAATEHWSLVLEGVHLVPGMIATEFLEPSSSSALSRSTTRTCTAAISGSVTTRLRLRPLEKYLDALPQIRQIQDYLVERAHRYDVPVILNDSLDRAIGDVMDLVLRRAEQLVGAPTAPG